jgi:hypothetical protein
MEYLSLKHTLNRNGGTTEKKLSHDKIYEETYINTTPLIERKFYENTNSEYKAVPVHRRVSEVVYSKYSDSKINKFYVDPSTGSSGNHYSIGEDSSVPKRHPTSIMVLKSASDYPEHVYESESKAKSLFATKYN